MRKDLGCCYPCGFTDRFHFRPDVFSGKPCSVSGEKNLAGDGFLFFGILEELPTKLAWQQDRADLALEGDLCPSLLRCLNRDILYLGNTDAGRADGFHEQRKALLSFGPGGLYQPHIFYVLSKDSHCNQARYLTQL